MGYIHSNICLSYPYQLLPGFVCNILLLKSMNNIYFQIADYNITHLQIYNPLDIIPIFNK